MRLIFHNHHNFMRIFTIYLLIFLSSNIFGQASDTLRYSCGVPQLNKEQADAMALSFGQFQKTNKNSRLQGVQAVSLPIKIHIVLKNNGYGDVSSSLSSVFSNLNFWFANMGVSFYQYGNIDYIYSDNYYSFSFDNDQNPIMENLLSIMQ